MGIELLNKVRTKLKNGVQRSYQFKDATHYLERKLFGFANTCDAYDISLKVERIESEMPTLKLRFADFQCLLQFDEANSRIAVCVNDEVAGVARLTDWDMDTDNSQEWEWVYIPAKTFQTEPNQQLIEQFGSNDELLAFLTVELYGYDFLKPEKYRLSSEAKE